jgi:hypothetical protein
MKSAKPEKDHPEKTEPLKKEIPFEPKLPEIEPGPKELPIPEPEKPEKILPEILPEKEP